MVKHVHITLSDKEYSMAKKIKKDKTWKEHLLGMKVPDSPESGENNG